MDPTFPLQPTKTTIDRQHACQLAKERYTAKKQLLEKFAVLPKQKNHYNKAFEVTQLRKIDQSHC